MLHRRGPSDTDAPSLWLPGLVSGRSGCRLPDGDDYIVLAAETETSLLAAPRTAASATAELATQRIPVDITVLTDATERAALLNRLLKHASIDERHEVTRLCEVPIARLTPHDKPASDGSVAFSRIRVR